MMIDDPNIVSFPGFTNLAGFIAAQEAPDFTYIRIPKEDIFALQKIAAEHEIPLEVVLAGALHWFVSVWQNYHNQVPAETGDKNG